MWNNPLVRIFKYFNQIFLRPYIYLDVFYFRLSIETI